MCWPPPLMGASVMCSAAGIVCSSGNNFAWQHLPRPGCERLLSCCSACRVTPAKLQRRLQAERPALVDVRPRPEFDMAHLPGAL